MILCTGLIINLMSPNVDQRLVLFYKIINGLASVEITKLDFIANPLANI